MADESEEFCYICFEGATKGVDGKPEPLVQVCRCPTRVHARCTARWQLYSAGKKEEKSCRFCAHDLPDWRNVLTPRALPTAVPVLSIYYNNTCCRMRVRPGPDGLQAFLRQLEAIVGRDVAHVNFVFRCRCPDTGAEIFLQGLQAFEAAMHCACVRAAQRSLQQQHQAQLEQQQLEQQQQQQQQQRAQLMQLHQLQPCDVADAAQQQQRRQLLLRAQQQALGQAPPSGQGLPAHLPRHSSAPMQRFIERSAAAPPPPPAGPAAPQAPRQPPTADASATPTPGGAAAQPPTQHQQRLTLPPVLAAGRTQPPARARDAAAPAPLALPLPLPHRQPRLPAAASVVHLSSLVATATATPSHLLSGLLGGAAVTAPAPGGPAAAAATSTGARAHVRAGAVRSSGAALGSSGTSEAPWRGSAAAAGPAPAAHGNAAAAVYGNAAAAVYGASSSAAAAAASGPRRSLSEPRERPRPSLDEGGANGDQPHCWGPAACAAPQHHGGPGASGRFGCGAATLGGGLAAGAGGSAATRTVLVAPASPPLGAVALGSAVAPVEGHLSARGAGGLGKGGGGRSGERGKLLTTLTSIKAVRALFAKHFGRGGSGGSSRSSSSAAATC